jgi:GGDEF domain-containing protein
VIDQPDPPPPGGPPAERLARAARAAQQLCEVLWESLHEELRDPRAERIRELSERLAEVSSTVAMLAAPAREGQGVPERRTPPEPLSSERPPDPRPTPDLRLATHPLATAVGDYTFTRLVDEHDTAPPIEPIATVGPVEPEIEIRDVRREEGPSAWVSSVGRLLERHARDGLPFAVLLVEIVDVARLERSEAPHDMHGLVAQVEGALGRGMRTTDELSRESLGRYWLVAPETNGTGARMLAERLARLVRSSATHRGVPLEVAIGIAVCPDDGTEAPALAARADLGVYSARATGRSIAHSDPPQR